MLTRHYSPTIGKKGNFIFYFRGNIYPILSYNQYKYLTRLKDCIDIGIELCKIPHISEHCPKNVPSLFK